MEAVLLSALHRVGPLHPSRFLSVQDDLFSSARVVAKVCHDAAKEEGKEEGPELVIEGFDEEQVRQRERQYIGMCGKYFVFGAG